MLQAVAIRYMLVWADFGWAVTSSSKLHVQVEVEVRINDKKAQNLEKQYNIFWISVIKKIKKFQLINMLGVKLQSISLRKSKMRFMEFGWQSLGGP
ncbi:hypothetical protein AAZX31_13G232200 [Glycine max]